LEPGTRACIAYVAGRLISGRAADHLFDMSKAKYLNISGSIEGAEVNVFDFERRCRFTGTLPSLFDYGCNTRITLKIEGSRFSGFDLRAAHLFAGSMEDNQVKLYDYGVSRKFSYQL
jgi:hypothetical protein